MWGSDARADENLFRRVFGDIVVGSWCSVLWLWIICAFLICLVVASRWCVAASAALKGFVGLGGLYFAVGGLGGSLDWFADVLWAGVFVGAVSSLPIIQSIPFISSS